MSSNLFLLLAASVLVAVLYVGHGRSGRPVTAPLPRSLRDDIQLPAVDTCFARADSLKYIFDYDDAAVGFERLLAGSSARSGVARGYALNQLAFVLMKLHRDSAAAQRLDELGNLWPDHREAPAGVRADWAFNRGLLAFHRERPQEALHNLRDALVRYQRLYGRHHWRVAQCLNELAMVHYEYTPAFDSFCYYAPRAYELLMNHREWKPYSREVELTMGYYSLWHRDYQVGQTFCDNALNLALPAPYFDTLFVARCLSMKGNMLKKLGQQDAADALFARAIALAVRTGNVRLQEFYKDRIINCMYRGEAGWPCFTQHLDSLETLLQRQPDRHAYPERLRAYFQFKLGDYARCIPNYERFLRRHAADSLCQPLIIEEAHYCLAHAYLARGDYDAALKNARLLLVDNNPGFSRRLLPLHTARDTAVVYRLRNPFVGLGIIGNVLLERYRAQHRPADLLEAFRFYALSDSLLFPRIVPTDEDAVLAHQSEFGATIYPNAVEATYALYRRTGDARYLDYALRFSERMKSFLLYRDMQLPAPSDAPGQPPETLLDSLRRLDARVKNFKMRRLRQEFVANRALYDELAVAQSRLHAMFQELKHHYPAFYRGRIEQPVATVGEIRRRLRPGQAVVQYSLGTGKVHILFIARDRVDFYQRTMADSLFRRYYADLRAELSARPPRGDTASLARYRRAATALHRYLVEPYAASLARDSALLIIPDAELHLVPFEALTAHDRWQEYRLAPYLLREAELRYAPSWKVYQADLERTQALPPSPRVLAFSYGRQGNLPYADAEVDSLQRYFGRHAVTVARDGACSSRRFRDELTVPYDIVHLSLHASSSLRDKLDNKIVFSMARRDTLYGFDILPCRVAARLVVLSACESASGATKPGEGPYSLARAFLQAGAAEVVSTLWQVSDYTTGVIMADFYARLAADGVLPPAALCAAKRRYLDRADAFTAHPAYWAGAICQG